MHYQPRLLIDLLPEQQWQEISLNHLEPEFFREAIKWCDGHDSNGSYSIGRQHFYFNQPEDAIVFALRWL